MMYAVRQALVRLGQLVALVVAAFSVQAMAQFEIAPDHFDSNTSIEKKQAIKPATAKPPAQVAASPVDTAKAQGSGESAVVAPNGQMGTTAAGAGSQPSAASTRSTTKKEAARRKKRAAEKVALATTH